ncbi:thymidylate synthase Thy1 [Gemmobacter caeni]|uniref:Thymidylate synthase Thy1 n=1 Tax=Gemmobacter caeni TaxID=589035 RepID=A0A2T6AZ35_9RHOB|nr:FAD-dependent thymidylate synthase [Gemmobacter caeni]PTX49077.1 thymidylate synthase Thy1 [Gemmobacter caeni]TWI98922.1 thymidylate synthase Thy1 [Gemmobacter caeni]
MTITAKVIAHSRAEGVPDLITLQLRYPRFIHSEFMTHRVFSRNASSSRAIPIERMIQDVIDDPAMPVAWGSNKPGMQAGEECRELVDVPEVNSFGEPFDQTLTRELAWCSARNRAVEVASAFAKAGYHKQIVNRLLEPFAHISVVVTATEWDNFFALRCHPDADPTMRALAEAIRDAIAKSNPHRVPNHLPYVTLKESFADVGNMPGKEVWAKWAMISAARCARVSYLNHDGTDPDIEKDLALAKRLLEARHMSPFEHQGMAIKDRNIRSANFVGWAQHRVLLESNPDMMVTK